MIEQWSVTYREDPTAERGPFARFPAAVLQVPLNPRALWEPFLKLRGELVGSITAPPRVFSDLRYRLVYVHEIMHAFHHRFREPTFRFFTSYLMERQKDKQLPLGEKVYAPVLIARRVAGPFPHLDRRAQRKRPDGYVVRRKISQSVLAMRIVMSQFDELFADFFSAAAAGSAFWSTIADFELEGSRRATSMLHSTWDLNYPHLFEPHPNPWVRIRYLPWIFAEVFGATMVAPGPVHVYSVVGEWSRHFHERILPKLPAIPPSMPIVYFNDDAEPNLRRIEIGLEFLLPMYRIAFEAFSILMNQWWLSLHPLAALTLFSNVNHHFRIKQFAQQFAKGDVTPSDPFDSVAGAAGARLAYDWGTAELGLLQERCTQIPSPASIDAHTDRNGGDAMNTTPRYNELELQEVARFLRGTYLSAASKIASARRRDPTRAVAPELERLRKLAFTAKETPIQLSDLDVEELAQALESSYASDISNRKRPGLERLRSEAGALPRPLEGSVRFSLALVLLKNVSRTLCKRRQPLRIRSFTISATSLSLLLRHVGLDPIFAPVVVWLATLLRDVGVPAFCGTAKDYLASKGIA